MVGIEAMNACCGGAYLDVRELAEYRQLDTQRLDNLLIKEKTVALPYSLVTLKAHLVAPLRQALPAVIEWEVRMHEQTFHQPEVKDRIKTLF